MLLSIVFVFLEHLHTNQVALAVKKAREKNVKVAN